MSRSTLIFSLVAELLLAPATGLAAKKGGLEKCFADCDQLRKSAEKSCKKAAPGGKCDSRVYDDVVKRCKAECAKRNK
jgi:hypothetical protein